MVYRAQTRADRVRLALEAHPLIRGAAIVADRWHMDIVDVLAETDRFRRAIRVAGHNVLCREEARTGP